MRTIETELQKQIGDVVQTIEIQGIVHHTNSWRLQSVYCFGGAASILLAMLSPMLGLLFLLLLLYSLYQDFSGAQGWLRGFSRKQIGNNYLIWKCNRFPPSPTVSPLNASANIIALPWCRRSEGSLEQSWLQVSSALWCAAGLLNVFILLGNIPVSLIGLATILVLGIILRFAPPSKMELCEENILLAKKILREYPNDSYLLLLFEGGSCYDSLSVCLQNYAPLFEKENTPILQLNCAEGPLRRILHRSQKNRDHNQDTPITVQTHPVHRPAFLGWPHTTLTGDSSALFDETLKRYTQCSTAS